MRVSHCLLDDVATQHDTLSSLQSHEKKATPPRLEKDGQRRSLKARVQLQNSPSQATGGTLQLLKHVRSGNQLGAFLQIALDWTKLHAGASFRIVDQMTRSLPATRSFLRSVNASMHVPAAALPRLPQTDDSILMDEVLNNTFTPRAVKKINLCRLFLQVESLAEI
jgi:hypothetical protein